MGAKSLTNFKPSDKLEKLVHFHRRYCQVQKNVLKVIKWALLPVRLIGYFPYEISEGDLTYTWKSVHPYYCLALFPLTLFVLANHVLKFTYVFTYSLLGTTEKVAYALLTYTTMIFSLSCKYRAMAGAKALLETWKLNIRFVTCFCIKFAICMRGTTFNAIALMESELGRLELRVKRHVAFVTIVTALELGLITVSVRDLVMKLCVLFWCLVLNLHTMYCQIQVQHPRLYTVSVKLMASAIRALAVDKPVEAKERKWARLVKNPEKEAEESVSKIVKMQDLLDLTTKMVAGIDDLLEDYNEQVGQHLVLQVLLEILTLLGWTFVAVAWWNHGFQGLAYGALGPVAVNLAEMMVITSAGSELQEASDDLMTSLNLARDEFTASPEFRFKLKLLSLKMTNYPPKITPQGYFTLDSRILSSITAVISTFMIVLIQFKVSDTDTET